MRYLSDLTVNGLKSIMGETVFYTTETHVGTVGGSQTNTSTVNAITLSYSSGNINSGIISLYGVLK